MGGDLPVSLVSKYYQHVFGLVKVQNVKSECHCIDSEIYTNSSKSCNGDHASFKNNDKQ